RTVLVRERAKQGLLQEFEQVVYAKGHLQPGRETFDCVRRFRDHYADILNGDHQVELESWEFDNILTLLREAGRADFWVPPVLYFLDIYGHHRITAFMKKLENKFSGDWFLRGTPTSRIEAMNRILRKIYEIEQKGGMKDDKIDSLLSSDVFSVDTVELFRRLDHWPIYGQPYGAYLLLKIDMITGGPTNRLQPPRQISVEHVLPQNPAGNSKWCADFSDIEREEWTNRLGNLVLIGRRKNASLGRRDFGEKKTRYFSSHVQTFASAMKVMKEVDWTPGTLQQFHQERIIDLKSYFA
ncbi:HNH endonuclease family protein, partial [Armatimonas sp.]|uniref:HNH endonuclease family protein n=1 Tax=Armatimonas sp. TaxID=1872638 RepID=UPI00286A56B6